MDYENKEEDNTLPKATVERLLHMYVPKSIIITKESREVFMSSCLEFLKIICVESTKICEKEKKKTISFEHFLNALEENGFGEYVEDCRATHVEYEKYLKNKPSKINKFKDSGLSLDELHNQQLELFKNAKKEFEKSFDEETK
ncbi:Negative cofactor 2 complex subunit beta [Nosema granulosis]|uniref:Negative cofactor 2 complex subunit beta n=1 Tax=Nosema granulosis TaxID=83296 RepID=A0A9P6H082_9MICR|nr:Negative cofactor 2 complex subunit beta [Nosema granulosis]